MSYFNLLNFLDWNLCQRIIFSIYIFKVSAILTLFSLIFNPVSTQLGLVAGKSSVSSKMMIWSHEKCPDDNLFASLPIKDEAIKNWLAIIFFR